MELTSEQNKYISFFAFTKNIVQTEQDTGLQRANHYFWMKNNHEYKVAFLEAKLFYSSEQSEAIESKGLEIITRAYEKLLDKVKKDKLDVRELTEIVKAVGQAKFVQGQQLQKKAAQIVKNVTLRKNGTKKHLRKIK